MSTSSSVASLNAYIRQHLKRQTSENEWLSVYLGHSEVVQRIYTTRDIDEKKHQNWINNNGFIMSGLDHSNVFSTRSLDYDTNELVVDLAFGFKHKKSNLFFAVMFETYDEDAWLGSLGVTEFRICRYQAYSIAKFFGFSANPNDFQVILPDLKLKIGSLRRTSIEMITEISDEMLKGLKKSPNDVFQLSSRDFEKLVARLLVGLGYEVWLMPGQKDGARDIIAHSRQATGSEIVSLVECKKWRQDRKVPISVVRGLYGVVNYNKASSGMIVSTSGFTKDAVEFCDSIKYTMSLKDLNDVKNWLENY